MPVDDGGDEGPQSSLPTGRRMSERRESWFALGLHLEIGRPGNLYSDVEEEGELLHFNHILSLD